MDAFIGEIRAFGFDYTPDGWLSCNGQSVSIQQYSVLYAVIGSLYGPATGSTFTLPNIPGKVLVGSGQLQGGQYYFVGDNQVAGEIIQLSPANMPAHSHCMDVAILNSNPWAGLVRMPENGAYISNFGTDTDPIKTGKGYAKVLTDIQTMAPGAVGSFGQQSPVGHDNMQPYLPLNYCINYDGFFPVTE